MSIYQTPEPPKKSVLLPVVVTLGIVVVLCGAMVTLAMIKIAPYNNKPAPAPVQVFNTEPAPSPSPSPSLSPTPSPTPTHATTAAAPAPTRAAQAAAVPQTHTVDLYPVTALGSQATIDQGKLVTWMTSPTCLLAGHDSMGWAFLNSVPTGTVVDVHTGPCAGSYKIVAHNWQSVKGGAIPGWMGSYALVLQSCTGAVGMGFSMAQRI